MQKFITSSHSTEQLYFTNPETSVNDRNMDIQDATKHGWDDDLTWHDEAYPKNVTELLRAKTVHNKSDDIQDRETEDECDIDDDDNDDILGEEETDNL